MNFDFIKKALSEAENQPSSIRLFAGWAIFFFVLALTFGFIWVVLFHDELILMFAGILSALISTILGMKVWQKGKEEKDAGQTS
jgi:membrane protein DedA with SNARE-associated domain